MFFNRVNGKSRMKYLTSFFAILLVICPGCVTMQSGQQVYEADIVIYGGTSSAVIAAVQAKRMGKSVIFVSPDKHLGGLSAGGLGQTDSGRKEVIGGLSREFYERLGKYYGKKEAQWKFEPHVAEQVFEDFVAEYNIPVHRDEWLDRKKGVKLDGAHRLDYYPQRQDIQGQRLYRHDL